MYIREIEQGICKNNFSGMESFIRRWAETGERGRGGGQPGLTTILVASVIYNVCLEKDSDQLFCETMYIHYLSIPLYTNN